MKPLLLFLCLSIQSILTADILEKLQILSKHNESEVVIGNELGVNFVGGAGMARADVIDINPVHVALPTIKAGCGGIDYTMGSINIASGEEMKNSLKAIIDNSIGYAFQLVLETVAPSVAETVVKIQGFANELNSININSCEIAQSLVNAAVPSIQAGDRFICEHSSGKLFKDHIDTRHNCHSNTNGTLYKSLKNQSQNTDLLAGDYNIAKKVFDKLKIQGDDRAFFLNLTGTVVGSEGKVTTYPPKELKTVEILLKGGVLKEAYHFFGEFGIEKKDLTITTENGWVFKKEKAMTSLLKKIQMRNMGDGELTDEESALLNGSKLPIGTLLVMKTRKDAASNLISLRDYSEIEAFLSLKDSVFDVLNEVRALAVMLLDAQVSDGKLKEFIDGIDNAKQNLTIENTKILEKINQVHQLEKWLREVEKNQRLVSTEEANNA